MTDGPEGLLGFGEAGPQLIDAGRFLVLYTERMLIHASAIPPA